MDKRTNWKNEMAFFRIITEFSEENTMREDKLDWNVQEIRK